MAAEIPNDFPQFIVPGYEQPMRSLRELYWLHYQPAGPLIPLWDEWMPMSTLWPARGQGTDLDSMRSRWSSALAGRVINTDGYVNTQQHDGPAHAEGWPFPLWSQAGGIGWHFQGTGVPGYDGPKSTPEQWELFRAKGGPITNGGWQVDLVEPFALLKTPAFSVAARVAPWLRLNWWAEGLDQTTCYVEWTTADSPEFSLDRRFYFAPATSAGAIQSSLPMGGNGGHMQNSAAETRTMIPVHRSPNWKGTITRLRLGFENRAPAHIIIKSFHTACDTRHPINNPNFIRGVHDYFAWSRDINFLRNQMNRVRQAMRFTMTEFDTRRRNCIYTTWIGHEGRSGIRREGDGKKEILRGEGIGGNYWDLLPFGGEDALATIYYYDALKDLADLEQSIIEHPEWGISIGALAFHPSDLREHATAVREYGTKRFWNEQTKRFGTVDLDGVMHDYGWTFLNNEAIYYGFATLEQARFIRDWISGRRMVEEDTSKGQDIFHWRFGPRASTRRNLDYYFWAWSNPESIPWGYQVQDGGAVLGFSFHDLMARLQVDGADDTWQRLREILIWFDEVQAEGGYRSYYAKNPARGSMQGGNVPGGLGLDREFFESILVPQVMIYGFLGLKPSPSSISFNPRLPKDWPELTITRLHWREHVFKITAKSDQTLEIDGEGSYDLPWTVQLPNPSWKLVLKGGLAERALATPTHASEFEVRTKTQ